MAGKPKDILGQRFGSLTVLEITDERRYGSLVVWKCRCDCGNISFVDTSSLTLGKTKSCGCSRIKDISGQRFGRLIAIETTEQRVGSRMVWRCLCDCGKECFVSGTALRNAVTRSCGCLARDLAREKYSLPNGEASFNALYSAYKLSSKKRGYSFELNKDEFRDLVSKDCFYCDSSPFQVHNSASTNGSFIYMGIDRVDNEKGYIFENCVPCCKYCNVAKSGKAQDDFADWIYSVYNNFWLKQYA